MTIAKRLIEKGEKGAIVSVASRAGQNGSTVVDYGASKAAIAHLARIAAPTLVIHGTQDPILPYAHGEATAKAIPGAKLYVFAESAHATVLGRLLLSDLDLNALRHLYPEEPLPAYTARTPTHLAQLKALIDEDRARGFAVSQGGFETGISTIAAPVFGKVAARVASHMNLQPTESVSPPLATAAR